MTTRATEGPVQVFSLDIASLNAALRDLSERIDALKGLRGPAMIHDEVDVSAPSASGRAVNLASGVFLARFPVITVATTVTNPGIDYVEINTIHRFPFEFSAVETQQARVTLHGSGNEATSGKGVAMHDGNRVLAEVTWNDVTTAVYTGKWTTLAPNTSTEFRLYSKASSVTEDLTLNWVTIEIRALQA